VAAFAWLALGAALGAAAAWWWLRRAAPPGAPAPTAADRLTGAWRLDELAAPLVVARSVTGLDVPPGTRLALAEPASADLLRRCEVRAVAPPAAEFALAGDGRRGLLFVAGARPGALAISVTDPTLLARLSALAQAAWAAGTPQAERRALADLAGEPGLPVEVEGLVTQAHGLHGRTLLRLEDGGAAAAVQAEAEDAAWEGKRVRVRGRLARDASGYAVVAAERIQPAEPAGAGR